MKLMRAFLFLNSIVLISLQFGCAARLDDVDDRLSDLQKRTALLEQKSGMPIGSDRDLLDAQRLADMRTQVAALRNELTVLTGKVDALEFENKNLNAQVRDLGMKAETTQRELNQAVKNQSATAGGGVPAEGELSDVERQYNEALKLYQDGDFDKAEAAFTAFLSKHPKHSLSDNALFWLGEGYMARKMYKSAAAKFQDLIDNHPKSDMRCEAMTNQVKCLAELGMEKEAAAYSKVRDAQCRKN
jgi:tol-pal system protein YbgF